jgi:hypothetical protein
MGILDSIFGKKGGSNPASAASPYLNQIPGMGATNYSPYINSGLQSGANAKTAYDLMTSDPTGFLDMLMKNYKTSEGYNFEKDLLTKELGNTAAAGGIAGTPYDQLNQGTAVQGLLSKDMQQYLSNVLGIHKTGLEGETGIANRGFEASKALTDLIGGSLNQQGGLAFNNAQQKNSDRNSIFQALAKALGAGAGAIFGGPGGAAAGLGLTNGIFGGS